MTSNPNQLELFAEFAVRDRLSVSEALGFLFRHQLSGKPCERPFNSNRKAICKSIGAIPYNDLNEPDVLRHLNARAAGLVGKKPAGPQTMKHDLKLISMTDYFLRRAKKRRWVLDSFEFEFLLLPEENPVKDVKRPKTKPRKVMVHADTFARWIEHCSERLKRRTYFAIDTGLNIIDLERLRPQHYNAYSDCLDLGRSKTGAEGAIPVSDRCRAIILEAIREGRELVLDFMNHQKDVEETRRRSGVYFQFGRDLRTTYGNKVFSATNHDPRMAQRAMLHKDPRTFLTHYMVDLGEDLRPAIKEIEKEYS